MLTFTRAASAEPNKVKVFIGSMFEIGENTADRAGEYQHWLIDYDLGHRWAPEEGEPGEPVFMPRKGYEDYRVHQLNPDLVAWGVRLSSEVALKDSDEARTYRMRYPDAAAQAAPPVKVGTHMTGDMFFHGPGLWAEAQYRAELYGADD